MMNPSPTELVELSTFVEMSLVQTHRPSLQVEFRR